MKFILTLLLVGLLSAGCAQYSAQEKSDAAELIERGDYLVSIAGCNDCHTPFKMGPNGPEPDMSRMLSGHPQDLVMSAPPVVEMPWGWSGAISNTAFAGPWGISYAFNL